MTSTETFGANERNTSTVNTTLTRDLFIELLDFIEEPDDDTTAAEGSDA